MGRAHSSLSMLAALPTLAGPLLAQARVNAPVAPEAIYAGCAQPNAGIAVMDLNGFGQGTGDPANTRFPLNPNVGQPGVWPPLALGSSRLDAGSAGVLTWTLDTYGSQYLLGPSTVGTISDLALGQPLDLVFHNEAINQHAAVFNHINPAHGLAQPGNTIMVAPHPNPPRIVVPSPNPGMLIFSEEPTVTTSVAVPGCVTTTSPPCVQSPINILVAGNPFSNQRPSLGIFGASFPGVFYGPQPPPPQPPPPPYFAPYTCRQQVGHFLYAVDRDNKKVVVVNSNSFLVLKTIALPDPTSLAMAPNLKLLAVSNFATSTVSLIDVDPLSPTSHLVVATIPVAQGPRGLAWQPEGEDLLVCSETASTLSVISGATLRVRTSTSLTLAAPFEVAVTGRLIGFSSNTYTYFAYVLNGNGTVSIFESGPSIIGPDDVTAVVAVTFPGAQAVKPHLGALSAGCYVAHRDSNGLAQVSMIELTSSPFGPRPYVRGTQDANVPDRRQREWTVVQRIGGTNPTTAIKDRFSGNALVDLAFDDILNMGGFPDVRSPLLPGLAYAPHSGKGHVKITQSGLVAAHRPMLMFAVLADTDQVDVFEFGTGRKLMTRQLAGVRTLAHYWRQ